MKPIPYVSAPSTRYISESVKQVNNGINVVNQEYQTLENKLQGDQKSEQSLLYMRNAISVMRDNTERIVQKYNALYEDLEVRAHISNLRDKEIQELKLERRVERSSKILEFLSESKDKIKQVALTGALLTALCASAYTLGYGVWNKLTVGELAEHIGKGFPGKYEVKE